MLSTSRVYYWLFFILQDESTSEQLGEDIGVEFVHNDDVSTQVWHIAGAERYLVWIVHYYWQADIWVGANLFQRGGKKRAATAAIFGV